MIYEVQICFGRNTFWDFEVMNYDDSLEVVQQDMEQVANRMGGDLIYVNLKERQ